MKGVNVEGLIAKETKKAGKCGDEDRTADVLTSHANSSHGFLLS